MEKELEQEEIKEKLKKQFNGRLNSLELIDKGYRTGGWSIKLDGHELKGIKKYVVSHETNDVFVNIDLSIIALVDKIEINKKANLK